MGFWTALLDAEVSHKSLVSLLYCLTERPKQVSLPETLQQVVCNFTSFRATVPLRGIQWKGPRMRLQILLCGMLPDSTSYLFFFQSLTDRLSAIYAAQLYLVLLQMPGQ